MTSQRITPKRVDVQTGILSNILPGHASVTDAVTRLQRERDLALRRVDELHDHYKKRAFLESLKHLMRLGNLLVTKT